AASSKPVMAGSPLISRGKMIGRYCRPCSSTGLSPIGPRLRRLPGASPPISSLRAVELGLAVAPHSPPGPVRPWHDVILEGGQVTPRKAPVVIELASLWAGPLCGHLLGLTGARVIKVESNTRPDGGRFGP